MVGMPYHLEKGPWLSVFEDYLNSDQERTYGYLQALRASRNSNVTDMEESLVHRKGLSGDPEYKTAAQRKTHLDKDWYGIHETADGRWMSHFDVGFVASTMELLPEAVRDGLKAAGKVPDGGADRASIEQFADDVSDALAAYDYQSRDEIFHTWPKTGFWFQYFGDVQSILRETFIRAIEVSLGLPHVGPNDKDPGATPDRHIPIELFWKCPQRWLEGWVCWRCDAQTGSGQVTVMLATPGHGKPVLESPLAGYRPELEPSSHWTPEEGEQDPHSPALFPDATSRLAPKGMWVITHEDHAQLPATPDEGATTSGRWMVPSFGPTYVGVGQIVTVAPSEQDGGVRPYGRREDGEPDPSQEPPSKYPAEKAS